MKKDKFFKTLFIIFLIFSFIFTFDMLTKYILIGKLIPNVGDSVDFIDGFINFVYVQNYGAGWGILSGRPVLLIILTLIILSVLVWFYITKTKKQDCKFIVLLSFAIGFIISGCIGNLYDRIVFGYVRDFINFQFMSFPVFNIADISLTIGVILFVLYFLIDYISVIRQEKVKKLENNSYENLDKNDHKNNNKGN